MKKFTIKDLQQHLATPITLLAFAPSDTDGVKQLAPRIVCADGVRISVQASVGHYSSPRRNTAPFSTVEVVLPQNSRPGANWETFWEASTEGDNGPVEIHYGFVPVQLVVDLINEHGGIAPNCDSCHDDVSIDCHDCEQHQQAKWYADDLQYIQEVESIMGRDIPYEENDTTAKLVYELNAEGKSPHYAAELLS